MEQPKCAQEEKNNKLFFQSEATVHFSFKSRKKARANQFLPWQKLVNTGSYETGADSNLCETY